MSLKGSDNLVYLDESGFEEYIYRPYGWSTAWQAQNGDKKLMAIATGKEGQEPV